MAFKRRRFSRNRFRRRGGFKTRRFIRKVGRIAKRTIRRMSEIKRNAFTNSTTVQNTAQLIEIGPTIAQGVDKDQRIGNKIRYRYLTLWVQAFAQNNQAQGTGPAASTGRIVLLTARKANLTTTDVIETGVASTPTIGTSLIPLRSETVNVLKDVKFIIGGAGTAGGDNDSSIFNIPTARTFKFSRRITRTVLFAAPGDTRPTDPQDKIYLYMTGSSNVVSITYTWGGRLSFIDI